MCKINKNATYGDVIDAILKSDMLASYKVQLVSKLNKNADSETYQSVIQIVNSNIMSSYKVESILAICGTDEES